MNPMFFFKQKTAYEIIAGDWSSDVCSSDLNPMWHLVGSDAHNYFVGNNLNVYVRQDLPIASGQP